METYSFTKQKIAEQRREKVRRAAIVIASAAGTACLGFMWADSSEVFGALRISILGGAGALVALVLTK